MSKVKLRERRSAHAVRATLNESARQLLPDARDRLAAARRMVPAQKKTEASSTAHSPTLAMPEDGLMSSEMEDEAPSPLQRAAAVLRRLDLLWLIIVLVAGFAGIYQWQQQQRVDELAEVDVTMSLDDLPLAVYVDQGFHQYLKYDQQKADR